MNARSKTESVSADWDIVPVDLLFQWIPTSAHMVLDFCRRLEDRHPL
jgi:hypothetical protein